MPLHERDTVREQLDECVFVGHDMTREVPKYRFPAQESPAREAYQVVADELMLDGNARQNLATFCQTWAEPELLALMALSVHKNLIDKDEYPQSAEIEARCVHMLADLWNAPDAGNAVPGAGRRPAGQRGRPCGAGHDRRGALWGSPGKNHLNNRRRSRPFAEY
jgi:glutamate decarboxylase